MLGFGIMGCLFLGLITAWLKSSNILFSSPDIPFWLSLPLTNFQVISGKMFIGYIFVLIPTLILMLPPVYLVGITIEASLGFYVLGLLGATVLSIPVYILGTGIGILTEILFQGLSSKSTFIKTFISILLVVGVIVFSFTAGDYHWNGFWQQVIDYMSVSRWIDFITSQYIKLLFNFSWIRSVLYFLQHLVLIGLLIGVINRYYPQLLTRFKPKQGQKQRENISYKETSQFMTLYKREFKRYFSSSIYVLNTMINEVLLVVFTILIVARQGLALHIVQLIGQEFGIQEMSMAMLGIAISLLMVMGCTTASTISLEGKQISLLKSFPVSITTIFKAKIVVNLTLSLTALIICLPLIFFVLPFTIVEMILTTWLTITYSVFSALLGLICNLKFPVFNWQTEANVVKQSISVAVSLLGGMLAVIVPVFVGLHLLSIEMLPLLLGLAISVTLINLGLGKFLKTVGVKWFSNLDLN